MRRNAIIIIGLIVLAVTACSTKTTVPPASTSSEPAPNNNDEGMVEYQLPTLNSGGDCARGPGEHPALETILGGTDAVFIAKVSAVRQSVTPYVTYSDDVHTVEDCGYIEPALELEFEDVEVLAGAIDSEPLRLLFKPSTLDSWSSSIRSTGLEPTDFEWTNAEERITKGTWLGGMIRSVPNTRVYVLTGAFFNIASDGSIEWLEDGGCTSIPEDFADAETLEELISVVPEQLPEPASEVLVLDERMISATCFTPVPDDE